MSYSDAKYGLKQRYIFPNVDDISAAAVHPDEWTVSTKTKIIKFGMIGQDSDIRVSSDTMIELISAGATIVQNAYTTAAIIAASDIATGVTLTTATTVAANSVLQGAVGVIGSIGSFQYYVDYQEQFDTDDCA